MAGSGVRVAELPVDEGEWGARSSRLVAAPSRYLDLGMAQDARPPARRAAGAGVVAGERQAVAAEGGHGGRVADWRGRGERGVQIWTGDQAFDLK